MFYTFVALSGNCIIMNGSEIHEVCLIIYTYVGADCLILFKYKEHSRRQCAGL
jgi:hypothetical protein